LSRLSPRPSLIRQTFLVAGLPLLLLTLFAAETEAQSPEDMVLEFAETASGFTLVGDIEVGALQVGRQLTFPVELDGDTDYMMVGFCDGDCDDLDMVLLGSSGEELESDVLPDAQPILIFTPPNTDLFTIRVAMISCSVDPCGFAVGIFTGEMGDEFGLPGETMEERMQIFRDEMINEGFAEMGGTQRGSLNQDQEIRFPVELTAGMDYEMFGVCDNDCDDMDLVIFDPSGAEVDSDVLSDAVPMVAFVPEESGAYRVAAIMVSCTLEPCGYEVVTFVAGEGIVPGGLVVSGTIVSQSTHHGALEAGDERLREGEFFDEYSVTAAAGQRVIVELRSPEFDTYLIVEAPDGTQDRNDDYEGDTMRSHIEMVAQEGGVFSIIATTFSAESIGEYTLQVVVVEGS
jgi:hypothetical protein